MNSDTEMSIDNLKETELDLSLNNKVNLTFDSDMNDETKIIKKKIIQDYPLKNNPSSDLKNSTLFLDSETNNLLDENSFENSKNFENNLKICFNPIDINKSDSSSKIHNTKLVINWKDEIFKGNFMPVFCLLDRKKINVDEIIEPNTRNTLLHLALSFSFTNVTKGLIEIFKCNLNSKNRFGHTAFHILCNNEQADISLFSYLVKNENLLLDEKDSTGVTPLMFTIISKQNLPFLILLFKKANIYNVDDMGNNALYFCLSADNKFALNFLLRHYQILNLNSKFFGNKATLSEILISQKGRQITKHLVKYFHHKIDLENIIASQKQKSQFNFYNNFNYDLFNTLYFYRTKNFFGILKKLISRNPLSSMTFKYYNFKFLIYDLILPNMNENIKYFLIAFYCCCISYLFFFFLKNSTILVIDSSNKYWGYLFGKFFFLLYQCSSIMGIFISVLKFYFTKIPKIKTCYNNQTLLNIDDNKIYYADNQLEESYTSNLNLSQENNNIPVSLAESIKNTKNNIKEPYYEFVNANYNSDNVLNILNQAVERNPLDFFFEEELCEICLIKKNKDTNHCHVCNRCIKEFYFHSKFLNVCFHRKNIYFYILFYCSLMAIHAAFILFLFFKVSNDFSKANNPDEEFIDIPTVLYQSESYISNFVTFLINLSFYELAFVLICLLKSILCLQNWVIIFFCVGYRVTYYNMFRMHKKAVGILQYRQEKICNIPKVNTISLYEFIKNIFKK